MEKEKWVMFDVWYNAGDAHCHFQYVRFEGAIDMAKRMLQNKFVIAVKIFDAKETYLYLKK